MLTQWWLDGEQRQTNLRWKGVSFHAVLGAELIVKSVMDVNLVEAIPIGQWSPGQVHRHLQNPTGGCRLVVDREDYTVPGVGYRPTHLKVVSNYI